MVRVGNADDGSLEGGPVAGRIVSLGEPFALILGETAVLEDGLEVTFASLIGDSRCPADVQCVWEGNAEIEVEIVPAGGHPAFLRLNTNPGFATNATYGTHALALVNLEPYPRTDREMDQPFVATLIASAPGVQVSPRPCGGASATAMLPAMGTR